MSSQDQITRLSTARNTIRTKLVELGLTESSAKLDVCATAVSGIANNGGVSATVKEGETYQIPEGYHNGTGTVSGVAGGGNYELQSKTVTPTKQQQSVTPDAGKYGLSDVLINAIPENFQDVSSVTAGAEDVLATKIIVDAEGNVTAGTMPNIGTMLRVLDKSEQEVIIPKGYHDGTGSVSIVGDTAIVTPTKENQTINPSTGTVLLQVGVSAIPDEYQDVTNVTATAPHVFAGDVFVDAEGNEVTGTMPVIGSDSHLISADSPLYEIPKGYHGGEGNVRLSLVEKTVTPTKSAQTVKADAGDTLSTVTVNAIPDEYITTADATAVAADILSNKTGYVKGEKITGSMTNNGAIAATIDGLSTTSYTVPKGYHNGTGTVSLTDAIETALAAI